MFPVFYVRDFIQRYDRTEMINCLLAQNDCSNQVLCFFNYRTWQEGKFIVFDDSFEHEVWHKGTELRLVLIVDFWHPELPSHERRSLSPI